MTSPVLREKQFEMGGVVFGDVSPIRVETWTPARGDIGASDTPLPGRDGVRMGPETRGTATWSWSLFTNGDTEEAGWAALSALGEAWDPAARHESDSVVPLRYRVAGQNRRVYGRPRRWTEVPGPESLSGRIPIEADFALASPLVFEDAENAVTFSMSPELDLAAGIIVPFIPPFNSMAGASPKVGAIRVGGTKPTPITLVFTGPTINARAAMGGWVIELRDSVSEDDPVTVDGRPWVRSATKRSGGAARLNPRVSRIAKMWLPPGQHTVTYTGQDPSATSTLQVRWRNAYTTPR